jgi:hypothetical protein
VGRIMTGGKLFKRRITAKVCHLQSQTNTHLANRYTQLVNFLNYSFWPKTKLPVLGNKTEEKEN